MTLNSHTFRHLRPNVDRVSASEWNRLVDLVSKISRSLMQNGIADSSGFLLRKPIGGGTPDGLSIFLAIAQEDAPADTNLSVKKSDSGGTAIGTAFDVVCHISGSGNLNEAIPRFATNDYLFITKYGSTWHCVMTLQRSEDCECL